MTNSQRKLTVTKSQADAITYYQTALQHGSIGKLLYAGIALINDTKSTNDTSGRYIDELI